MDKLVISKRFVFIILLVNSFLSVHSQNSWIRVNQVGYLNDDVKVAVYVSKSINPISTFEVVEAATNNVVLSVDKVKNYGRLWAFENTARLNFSELKKTGAYYIKVGDIKSPIFKIGNDIYKDAADIPLKYMRQQRCGYNPFLKDSCHVHDGITVGDPEGKRNGLYYNTTGGWHDASDYLQYVTTSANAVYQMLFAYSQHPESFGDKYDAAGLQGANGIPDILDEAKWGLDWLVKMNPDSVTYFNQLADDRDHAGFTLPAEQKVDYGWGKGKQRPVYFVSPKPQGIIKYKNRSTGMASTLGKYASSFSLGAKLLAKYYPDYANLLKDKARQAYKNGAANPGVSQTAPGSSPYFYEEDNWADDMQLAASQLFHSTGETSYLKDAVNYGRLEPITPWMGADSARHYQWYPFVNLGNYHIANQNKDIKAKAEFIRNMKAGIQRVKERAEGNAFMHGIPFIWCSNNLTVGFITQCRLYAEATGDTSFLEIETAMRDWLLGCNPWGTSMIVGYPDHGDTPVDPHSALTHLHKMPITGGIVDGPIYTSIYKSLIGIYLANEDTYAPFQSDYVVYHDDYADYSTNEPTMDGTASLTYYLGYLSSKANTRPMNEKFQYVEGGIVRGAQDEKKIALVFTGHEFADGGERIIKTLDKHGVKGSFFLTGDFYRKYSTLTKKLFKKKHYLGPHSDKHLLYSDWDNRSKTLINREAFEKDLKDNYQAMEDLGIKTAARLFIPPYEWYNQQISSWSNRMGTQLINFTSGTVSHADYTTPDMSNYRSSQNIYDNILSYEQEKGLNGFILLSHIGTSPLRTDKFYNRLDDLISALKKKGYQFVRVDELLK